jgi:hypothetical protein
MESLVQRLKFRLFDDLGNDIRFTLRSLRKHGLLSTAVVMTLAFGLGLNAGVLTMINAALFRAHVDKDPDTFFRVHKTRNSVGSVLSAVLLRQAGLLPASPV